MSSRLIRTTSLSRWLPNKYRLLQTAALTSRKVRNPSEFSRPAFSLLLPLSARGGCCWLATVSVKSSHYEGGVSSNIGTALATMSVALLLASSQSDYQQCEASRDVEAVQNQNEIVDHAVSKVLSRLSPLLVLCKYTPHELKDRKIHGGVQLHALIYGSELETAHRMVRVSQCYNVLVFLTAHLK